MPTKPPTTFHLTVRQLAHRFAAEGTPFDLAQQKAQRLLGKLATNAPANEARERLEACAAIIAKDQGVSLDEARERARSAGFGHVEPSPTVEGPRDISLRAVVRLLTSRGVPFDLAQVRAQAVVARARTKALADARLASDAPAPAAPATVPAIKISIRELALRLMRERGLSIEVAQQVAQRALRGRGSR